MHALARLLVTAAVLCPACAPDEDDLLAAAGDDEVAFRMPTTFGTGTASGGGTVFNTNYYGDDRLPELRMPFMTQHNGVRLKKVTLVGGEQLTDLEVVDGELIGTDGDGNPHAGATLIGSEWTLIIDGAGEPLMLTDMHVVDGVPHYSFTHPDNFYKLWASTCRTDTPGVEIPARLLSGFTLDEKSGAVTPLAGTTYFACLNGATGKAAEWGYYDLAVALATFEPFEAAIRVIRADYCYNGDSYTHAGVELAVEDRWGVMSAAGHEDAPVEAVWGADRLLCRGQGRSKPVPLACGDKKLIPDCPADASLETVPGADFITRVPLNK